MKDARIDYKAHPTLRRFHRSKAFHRAIMGPRGSGKSTGMCCEAFRLGAIQEPGPDGIRRTRGCVIRNTYRELEDTTMATWLTWFPEDYFGEFNRASMKHNIKYKDMEMEVLFRALDRPADVRKVLSLELSWAWVNEAREVPFGVIQGLDDAVGRYPSVSQGGCTRPAIMLDTNPPDDTHWWYEMSETGMFDGLPLDPKAWMFWKQPGGLIEREGKFEANPLAENLQWLIGGSDWYLSRVSGKRKSHIRVYYCNQYGFVLEGRPVHEEYVDAVHCADEELKPTPGRVITIGIDFGLTPAATFGQRQIDGRWIVFDELTSDRLGILRFADLLLPKIRGEYKDFKFEIYGDPAGSEQAQTDERSPFDILNAKDIPAIPAYQNNDPVIRRESLYAPLTRMIDGKPGFILSPKCRMLRNALKGGYHYAKLGRSGADEKYHEKPDKNRYSHIAEACEYMMLGAGEGKTLIVGPKPKVDTSEFRLRRSIESYGDQGWMA